MVDNDEPAETDPESTDPAEDTSADPGAKPTVEIPEGDAPTELVIDDLIEGTGAEAVAGQTVEVHYVGVLFDDGTEFDASWNRGQTFDFKLGQGQVIQGWDQGFEGMKVGGRRRLIIPSDLAYGPAGSDTIGPDATLVFVVDLVSVTAPPPPADPADEPELTYPDPVPTELVIEDLVEGEGDRSAQPDDTLIVNYVGGAMSTQEVVDSSWQRGEALRINLREIIPGWAQGVVGMKPGGRRMLVIPPELAYSAEGVPGFIAPDETLVFIVELIEIS
ncbi:MAG: peptidylprolyl isomerase [Actinomycetia bacterium]|nr:peptidylprolyl isomerase [Actinomycetes bacterium]